MKFKASDFIHRTVARKNNSTQVKANLQKILSEMIETDENLDVIAQHGFKLLNQASNIYRRVSTFIANHNTECGEQRKRGGRGMFGDVWGTCANS